MVFIGFGSNVGDRADYCHRAVTLLSLLPHAQVTGVSSLYETEPINDGTDPGEGWFLNGVVALNTEIPPRSLLSFLREIERALGRDPDHRAGPRSIDLDLLFYGVRVIDEPDLVVPHPRAHRRRFVLVPLNEIAPDWVHPVSGLSVRQMLSLLTDRSVVRVFSPPPIRVGFQTGCPSSVRP
ncbi:MAG: 2-amino-4-hydroxy-6-hydroxymethyldihydropteridine diphosphokinase [Nitrospira sp.]|nr:2-amino-4-hydroxy-6-hydroxymethyldihydropteridine diphosphokinase [Nitrospira sp.]MCP9441951.1 2-amino-4-hydroxy-6-hydroxymethyldihydropteridine diphosphokinase [Nitrospira sp.]